MQNEKTETVEQIKNNLVKAIDILYKISDVEAVVLSYLIATNTESRQAAECLRLNQNNFNELEELLQEGIAAHAD